MGGSDGTGSSDGYGGDPQGGRIPEIPGGGGGAIRRCVECLYSSHCGRNESCSNNTCVSNGGSTGSGSGYSDGYGDGYGDGFPDGSGDSFDPRK